MCHPVIKVAGTVFTEPPTGHLASLTDLWLIESAWTRLHLHTNDQNTIKEPIIPRGYQKIGTHLLTRVTHRKPTNRGEVRRYPVFTCRPRSLAA